MSYFQHTKRDVENARAAGVVEARAELADAFAALAADTSTKLDREDYDRGYVIEDLIGRMVELSRGMGGDPSLFESLRPFLRHTYAYPLIEETKPEPVAPVLDLTQAIRETWALQTFDGIPRHEHVGMPDDKCYRSFDGRKCDRYYGHPVHETIFEERTQR